VRQPHSAAQRADHELLAALRRRGNDACVAGAAKALSLAGEHGALWLAAGLAGAAADPGRRPEWLRATALAGTAHLVSMAAKRVVRRPRPVLPGAPPLVRTAGRHSFPSSHAASATAAVVAFAPLLPRPLGWVAPPVAAAMCLSRLVAGVHYPSDVACGALLGAVTAQAGRRPDGPLLPVLTAALTGLTALVAALPSPEPAPVTPLPAPGGGDRPLGWVVPPLRTAAGTGARHG
jgi:undecaprenyl-diphosphatase